MERYSRRRVLQSIGTGAGIAVAGCLGRSPSEDTDDFDSGIPTPDEDGDTPSYTSIGFVEAERDLEDHHGRLVAVEGWLRYRDNEQWWDDGEDTRWLETYDLFGANPLDADDPERLGAVTVVDDGSLNNLPDSVYTRGEPVNARIEGRADILFPRLGGSGQYGASSKYSHMDGDPSIKAHSAELLDGEN